MDIELTRLHPAQQTIIDSQARFKVLACGRRFGKTSIAVDVLCNRLLDGESVAYFAPTYKMAAEVWREVKATLRPLIRVVREHEARLELYTKGVFECWSLANNAAETVRGRKYHYVVIDEAAMFDSDAVWHGAIRPLLTDYSGGALFASTPRGRNWFWQLYLQGQNRDIPEWESWRYPTTTNPFIKVEEVEAARQQMPERFFRQEYLAEFLDDGGVVFRNIDKVCTGKPLPLTPSPYTERGNDEKPSTEGSDEWYTGERCCFGVDWGKDNDYTCISVMTREGKQIYLERFNHIGWAVQRGRLAALYEEYRPYIIMAEENSIGSVNIEALQNEGLPMQGFLTTGKSKAPLIENLVLAMEKGAVTLLNDPTLKHELMAYEMKRTSSGWSYGAPSGGHDDTVIATALSLWASQRYGGIPISFV